MIPRTPASRPATLRVKAGQTVPGSGSGSMARLMWIPLIGSRLSALRPTARAGCRCWSIRPPSTKPVDGPEAE